MYAVDKFRGQILFPKIVSMLYPDVLVWTHLLRRTVVAKVGMTASIFNVNAFCSKHIKRNAWVLFLATEQKNVTTCYTVAKLKALSLKPLWEVVDSRQGPELGQLS